MGCFGFIRSASAEAAIAALHRFGWQPSAPDSKVSAVCKRIAGDAKRKKMEKDTNAER